MIKKLAKYILKKSKQDVNVYYDEKFMKSRSISIPPYKTAIARVIHNTFKPRSVIDLGCSTGEILHYFEDIMPILGIDGSKHAEKYLHIDKKNFLRHDLRNEFHTDCQYDIALCLEVAEHIPEEDSDMLVANLCRMSDTILFTCARQNQLGTDHCNLQPISYWQKKFDKFNYWHDIRLTGYIMYQFSHIPKIRWYYMYNVMVLKKK